MKYQKIRSGTNPLFFWHIWVLFHLWCTSVKQEALWFPVFCPDSSQCCACLKWWRLRGCSWGNSYMWGKLHGDGRESSGQVWVCRDERTRQSKVRISALFPSSLHPHAHESSLYQFSPVAGAHTAVLQALFLPSPLKQRWDAFCHWDLRVQEFCHH